MNFKMLWFTCLIALVTTLLLSSCQDEMVSQQMNCQLLTAPIQFAEDSIQVVYHLEAKGDCELESFFYNTDNQKVTITNPDTIVEVFVTLSAQKSIQAGAFGTAMDGSIRVSFKATGIGKTYEAMDQCQQNILKDK
ncbi:MAG: hypothetical protein HOO86_06725 [Bacteroidales bacterium]|nr:hypothetical protein [Bacteroidales bacterium]